MTFRRILFTPDSRQAVTADSAGNIVFRDIATGKTTFNVPSPQKAAQDAAKQTTKKGSRWQLADIALSPDGNLLGVADTPRYLHLEPDDQTRWTRMEGPDGWMPGDRLTFRSDSKGAPCLRLQRHAAQSVGGENRSH